MVYVACVAVKKKCSSELKFDSSLTECSAFIGKTEIDWEQKRYELAKSAIIGILASPIVESIDPNPSVPEVAHHSVVIADAIIKELKENKLW